MRAGAPARGGRPGSMYATKEHDYAEDDGTLTKPPRMKSDQREYTSCSEDLSPLILLSSERLFAAALWLAKNSDLLLNHVNEPGSSEPCFRGILLWCCVW
jgi:hypothetical protein